MRLSRVLFGLLLAAGCAFAAQAAEVDEDGGHLKIENPAEISDRELADIYAKLRDMMVDGYALSDHPEADGYISWRQHNVAPYLSGTHGNRYVNSYANAKAGDYGKLKRGERMPAGAVLAKDSFTVKADGKVFPGALFIMEKLAPGTSTQYADWHYVMVMPDGSLFGDTMGDGAEQMGFCHECHKQRAKTDYLFFVPEKYRRASDQ